MDDDIVTRLRSQHSDLRQGAYYSQREDSAWDATADAADEIERLRAERDDLQVLLRGRTAEFQAEIERLRQRGDKLHTVAVEMPNPRHNLSWLAWRTQMDNALMGWEEARRG